MSGRVSLIKSSCGWFFLLFIAVVAAACRPATLYDWGSYDASVRNFYSADSSNFLDRDIERLSYEIAKTVPERIPPGKSAHLGYLYALRGDQEQAERYFNLEKQLFPESTVFIDRVISMNRRQQQYHK